MKNRNSIFFAFAGAGLMSLVPFSANADSSVSATLKQTIQTHAAKQLAAERDKYTRMVSLAGNRQDELATRKDEAATAYARLNDLKSALLSHHPASSDYKDLEMAANAYSQANKAFIDLQKDILAQNRMPLEVVATRNLSAAPTELSMK